MFTLNSKDVIMILLRISFLILKLQYAVEYFEHRNYMELFIPSSAKELARCNQMAVDIF